VHIASLRQRQAGARMVSQPPMASWSLTVIQKQSDLSWKVPKFKQRQTASVQVTRQRPFSCPPLGLQTRRWLRL